MFESFLVSLIITWAIGLTPPLVIQFLVTKKPISKGKAIALSVAFYFINFVIFFALGSKSQSHIALFLIGYASYYIYTKYPKPIEIEENNEEIEEEKKE